MSINFISEKDTIHPLCTLKETFVPDVYKVYSKDDEIELLGAIRITSMSEQIDPVIEVFQYYPAENILKFVDAIKFGGSVTMTHPSTFFRGIWRAQNVLAPFNFNQ